MRCEPERKSYQDWCTLTLEANGTGPSGFCLFSRQTMAAPGKGKKRRRTAYMVRASLGGACRPRSPAANFTLKGQNHPKCTSCW